MRFQDVPQKGKRGRIVASRNRFGPYQKEFVSPKQPSTAAQRGVWGNMAELSWRWNELSDERREAWHRLADGKQSPGGCLAPPTNMACSRIPKWFQPTRWCRVIALSTSPRVLARVLSNYMRLVMGQLFKRFACSGTTLGGYDVQERAAMVHNLTCHY
jgi:hypothetical protein